MRIFFIILGVIMLLSYDHFLLPLYDLLGNLNFETAEIKSVVLSIFLVLIGLLYPFKTEEDNK